MRLHLQHIGPLREASIDLAHDFILLTGPNGTGKTFAAYCVYGSNFENQVETMERISFTKNMTRENPVAEGVFDKILTDNIENYATSVTKGLPNLFAQESSKFDKNAKISFELLEKDITSLQIENFTMSDDDLTFTIQKNKCELVLSPKLINNPYYFYLPFDFGLLFLGLSSTCMFPTERIALSSLHQSLKPDYKDKNLISRYKKPILDHLEMLNDMVSLSKNTSELAYLAEYLETELLKGKITTSQYGELRYKPTGDKNNYSISLSASITKSLASLVFYFRHLAKAGDRIIIDEPELNLHPDNQRIIARFLVRAMNAGIRILISTHSDHLIRELNNLMMLGSKREDKKAKKLMREYKYKPEDLLDYTKVGAYLFLGDTCEQLEVEKTGFSVATIDKAINDQNEASDMIYLTLFD